ncbi:histidine phosphatase family protein [Pseudalkalibacillus decolorationis]|uniref:histidine phosphatase family protein n=1 Tax=Pseudalkalibacillus decolorationis TaxID=163879 RepID=UPI0021488182|nr:histidine phosphatase family protein [Pseudalkalibacillus decolorationis]
MDELVVIALFRHGVTEDNTRKAYCGWTDSPLCSEELTRIPPFHTSYNSYFSSDLTRCKQTSNLLFPNATPILIPELREMHFGQWEGKTYSDLKELKEYQEWISNPVTYSPPEGESFKNFTDRIEHGLGKVVHSLIQQPHTHSAAIVTHGGVIRYILSKYAPSKKTFWEWPVPHGRAYELRFKKEALRRGERCTLLQEVLLTENERGC